ncbi:MAG: hypothetical protein KGJ06_04375 [Pseudomonadota bacterium]|nr:hypothetical protein [Pseudomonadota bacterium]
MADGPVGGISLTDLLSQQRASQGSGGESSVNAKTTVEGAIDEGAPKAMGAVTKMAIAANLSEFGQVSLTKPVDTEGVQGKNIPSMFESLNTKGGVLAKFLHDIFVKNRDVTDHTGMHFGSGSGAGDGGSSSGGGDYSDYAPASIASAFNQMASDIGGPFEWSPVAMASLGGLPRPALPDMGESVGMGMSA